MVLGADGRRPACRWPAGSGSERTESMKKGDMIYTPRFCAVEINEVYEDAHQAYMDGYKEPTHYNHPEYAVLGKNTSLNHMVFAAVRK